MTAAQTFMGLALQMSELPDLPWSKLSGRCVLVTGAAGFLGSWITRTLVALHPLGLVKEPVQVIAMVRNTERARERLADVAGAVEFFEWDLNRIAVPDLAGVDYVIHAASQASPRFYGTDPIGTLMPNAVGTAALLEAASRACARGFLFVSSSEVYGAASKEG
ncbi:MAG: NAD-dependent epimerase/dehydratase family protein, partial [Inhella sp.]